MSIHIHAPQPSVVQALVGLNCPGRAPDGSRCGAYHALFTFTPNYGVCIACCSCGTTFGEDAKTERVDTERVRERFNAARAST